jgi:hypothetical protein
MPGACGLLVPATGLNGPLVLFSPIDPGRMTSGPSVWVFRYRSAGSGRLARQSGGPSQVFRLAFRAAAVSALRRNAKVFNAAPFQRSTKMVPVPPWAVAVVAAA